MSALGLWKYGPEGLIASDRVRRHLPPLLLPFTPSPRHRPISPPQKVKQPCLYPLTVSPMEALELPAIISLAQEQTPAGYKPMSGMIPDCLAEHRTIIPSCTETATV